MKICEILSKVDHTLLSPEASWDSVRRLCDEGILYQTASVCIPPAFVKEAKAYVGDRLPICTVIGFPNGYSTPEVKVFETKDAIAKGADEVDMVINIGALKDKNYELVYEDIKAVVDAANKEALVKVIIETCYLTDEEKKIACELAVKAGTDYVKTSTGFGTGGSTPADIKLMRETVGENIGVKASGGVRCEEDAVKVIDAGATRIGASASIAIVSGNNESKSGY